MNDNNCFQPAPCCNSSLGASDPFVHVHLGAEIHSVIAAGLGNRVTISRALHLEAEYFKLQSASSIINRWFVNETRDAICQKVEVDKAFISCVENLVTSMSARARTRALLLSL